MISSVQLALYSRGSRFSINVVGPRKHRDACLAPGGRKRRGGIYGSRHIFLLNLSPRLDQCFALHPGVQNATILVVVYVRWVYVVRSAEMCSKILDLGQKNRQKTVYSSRSCFFYWGPSSIGALQSTHRLYGRSTGTWCTHVRY